MFQGNPQAYSNQRLPQPNGGNLPSIAEMGPVDMLPGQHNPYFDVYQLSHGRYLGSLGQEESPTPPQAPSADAGVAPEQYMTSVKRAMLDYPNELDSLTADDDVQGNGIFDASGTHGNINPDEGIFADRESLPGYVARERFFQPSEVLDVNTGKPVMFVPGNGFMVDPRTPWQLSQAALYTPGWPGTGGAGVEQVSTVAPRQPGWPVYGPVGETAPAPAPTKTNINPYLLAGFGGLAAGLVLGLVSRK